MLDQPTDYSSSTTRAGSEKQSEATQSLPLENHSSAAGPDSGEKNVRKKKREKTKRWDEEGKESRRTGERSSILS